MSRQVVLLIFGVESSEHDISTRSTQNVFTAMDTSKYDTHPCFIDHSGKWWLVSNFTDTLHDHPGHRIAAVSGEEAFLLLDTNERLNADVLLPKLIFLMDAAGEVYINEINTLPGFTNISQYPKLW